MMSQTAEYALLAVIALADRYPHPLSVGRIASLTDIPAGYLSKVLQTLARGRIVIAHRGTRGGFSLTREPSEISALEVVNAVAPIRRGKVYPTNKGSSAPDFSGLKTLVSSAHDFTQRVLRESTIASMVGHRPAEAISGISNVATAAHRTVESPRKNAAVR